MKIFLKSSKYFSLFLLVSIIFNQTATAQVTLGSNACLTQTERQERNIDLTKILQAHEEEQNQPEFQAAREKYLSVRTQEITSLSVLIQCGARAGKADEGLMKAACTKEQEDYLNVVVSMQLAEAELSEIGDAPSQRMMERIRVLAEKYPKCD